MNLCHLSLSLSAAVDADTRPSNITFLLTNYGNGGGGCGVVSLRSRPAHPVSRFTQEDVDNGKVLFSHRGNK